MSQLPLDYAVPSLRKSILPAAVSRRLRRSMPYLAVAALCYVGSYICLSEFGRFEPAMIGAGANGRVVKWFGWAPAGLVSGYEHRRGVFYFYLPLYKVDRTYWHRDGDAYSGRYPTSVPSSDAEWAEWMGRH
jgi:hypothetical protein